jgi:hypothetical protein
MPRHKLLVILILAALTAVAALPVGAQARRSVSGVGFKTYVPSGWKIKHHKVKPGWDRITASPTGRRTDELSVTMSSIGSRRLAKAMKQPLPPTALQLVQLLSIVPPGATQAQVTTQPQPTTLGNSPAGIMDYHYVTEPGEGVSAVLIATRRGNRVFVLNIAGDDSLSQLAGSAVALIRNGWAFT